MGNAKKYTVKVCTDYVVTDPEKVKEILERVSKIVSNSYRKAQQKEVAI